MKEEKEPFLKLRVVPKKPDEQKKCSSGLFDEKEAESLKDFIKGFGYETKCNDQSKKRSKENVQDKRTS
jgi:hypothetical protein